MCCFSLFTAERDFHLVPDRFVKSCLKDGHGCQEHALSEEKYCEGRPERAVWHIHIFIFFIRVCDVNNDETFDNINLAEYIDNDIKDVAENDLL